MRLISYTKGGGELVAALTETAAAIFPRPRQNRYNDQLVLITDEITDRAKSSMPRHWLNIHHAWADIRSGEAGKEIQGWRVILAYGREIVPGLKVFRLRQEDTPVYFFLLDRRDFCEALGRLNDLFCLLTGWQHIKNGGGFFHAAGVTVQGMAYLFAGVSGAGKSTICRLSRTLHHSIIHDDHVVVYPENKRRFQVNDRCLESSGIPLRAVFFLAQDKTDHLLPLSPIETAGRLLGSALDTPAKMILQGEALGNTFSLCADMARNIPGFELHFRRAADFWRVIHAELGTPGDH